MARSGGHSTLTFSHGLFSSLLVLLGKGEVDDSASLGGIFTILPPSSSPDTQAARLWIPSPLLSLLWQRFQFPPHPSLANSKSQLGHSPSSDSSPSSPHLPPISPEPASHSGLARSLPCSSVAQGSLLPQEEVHCSSVNRCLASHIPRAQSSLSPQAAPRSLIAPFPSQGLFFSYSLSLQGLLSKPLPHLPNCSPFRAQFRGHLFWAAPLDHTHPHPNLGEVFLLAEATQQVHGCAGI